jgi:hypothetical protein
MMAKKWPKHVVLNTFFIVILTGLRLSPLGTAATTGLLY